ncbi:MAG TPA: MoaD/ThiS family protein [Pirellulales bacterium]|jgi:molybdopterin converting factor small subunit|nr:MoaD/ThiS family protein [Pirellulales bacterium]
MPRVFIPAAWRDLTGGVAEVWLDGDSLEQVVAGLEERFPGIAGRLCDGGRIASGLAVSIDGAIASRGLRSSVTPECEIHFLPAIGGG